MGVRMNFNPGLQKAGLDPKMVDQLVEVQKQPIEAAKRKVSKVEEEKAEFEKLQGLMTSLDSSLNGLKTRTDFYKLKLESSHPDIMEGTVTAGALLGSYEFEVRGLAKSEKELAYGFPDKNETPVGFGFMLIERADKEPLELTVEPYSTLQDVANKINDEELGVKAMVVNTGYKPDPFRLLVLSEDSGEEAKITIDPDTTFLEFKEQVTGKNLDLIFEDVPVTDADNNLDELISGVNLNIKRSEPGTKVQITVAHDVEATIEGIKSFVDTYNEISSFINGQFQENADTGAYGLLAGDSGIKMIMRRLQSSLYGNPSLSGKFKSLADIGITTDAKTGVLKMDDTKVEQSLADDYESVADLFIVGRSGEGVAGRVANSIKQLRDPGSGVIKSKLNGYEKIIEGQNKDIARQERLLQQKEETIRRRFTNLGTTLSDLHAQGDFLKAKLAAGGGNK